jgi:hypothetical protein
MIRARLLAATTGLALALAALSSCSGPLRSRFDGYGNVDAVRDDGPSVGSAGQVQVFYGTAPAGFSLRDNELEVEDGHNHRILGTVQVLRDESCVGSRRTKKDVIATLREVSYANGGNAVIYATSRISEQPEPGTVCDEIGDHPDIGGGWVVVLGEPDPAPAAALSAPPLSAPAPVAPSVFAPAAPTP